MNSAAKILAQRRAKANVPNLLDPLFPVQTSFILHPARLKALFATRRFGKSYTAGLYLFKEALENPGVSLLYVALTRITAKGIMWKDILKRLDRKYNLRSKFNETELTVTLPNGSVIYLMGADSSEDDKYKILGRAFKLAIIDEAASYTINLRELVYDVIRPAAMDLKGTIVLIGTPSNYPMGLFFDVTSGKEPDWFLVKANTSENPYMKELHEAEIANIKEKQPYLLDTPGFKQMYLGEWAIETDKLVYKFGTDNLWDGSFKHPINKPGWDFVLGIDLGWEDDTAFVLTGYHEHDPHLYVIKTYAAKHMLFDDVIAKTREFINDPFMSPCKIIIDGAAKQFVESMRSRASIPFTFADKNGKVDYIELLNNDLLGSLIKINRSEPKLIAEMEKLVWTEKAGEIVYPKTERAGMPNHLCDALLYAWRLGYHYSHTIPFVKHPLYSKGWYEDTKKNIWEHEYDALKEESPDYPSYLNEPPPESW